MEARDLEPFTKAAEVLTENHFKLIMARKAIWADVLQEPIPPELQALLQRLSRQSVRSGGSAEPTSERQPEPR
jgi:hypothetical protein